MQVYNIKIAFIKKVLFCFLLCTSSNLYAQSMQMPQMPAMPKMPTISSPTVNGRFYTPQPPKTQKQNSNSKTTTTTTTAPTETDKKGPEGFGGGVYPGNNSSVQMQQNQNSQNQNSQNQNVQNIANQKKINPSTGLISAQDVSMLYEAGLFGNYSSLLGAQSADSTTNIYLQQILASLQELKDNTKSLDYAEKENMENQQKDSKVFSKRAPSVVRFNINGYNIADSLVTVFISESENDGSFLFTADRVYYVDFQPRTETIYLLFKTDRYTGSATVFDVEPTLIQDKLNPNSFLYRMTQITNIQAQKTGNLVTLNFVMPDLNVDLLMDIDR